MTRLLIDFTKHLIKGHRSLGESEMSLLGDHSCLDLFGEILNLLRELAATLLSVESGIELGFKYVSVVVH